MSNPTETRHPLPLEEKAIEEAVLTAIGAHFAGFSGTMREAYDAMGDMTPMASGTTAERVETSEVDGWWVRPAGAPAGRAILFIHGGAYMLGSAQSYRGLASQLASRAGTATFVLDYPLAPENPFPAAPDAVKAALSWLKSQGIAEIAVVGDSAGGALSLASLGMRSAATPRIASAVVFSPWTDLTLSGETFLDPDTHDSIFKPVILATAAEKYLAGADPRDGRASPLFVLPENPPPVFIQVGGDELLLDDSRRYAKAIAAKGAQVRLDIHEGLHHVFQRATEELPSARNALDAAAEFLSDHWQ